MTDKPKTETDGMSEGLKVALEGVPNEAEQLAEAKDNLKKLGIESAQINVCHHQDKPDTLIAILTMEHLKTLVHDMWESHT